ncbi:hypothetical protein ZWY2020_002293 [Hordeum vulgare]|nr:hypothetical protein ZWY2020_002293 [Hordeum vulgare]
MQINPLLLCSRRRKREEDLDEEETRPEQQAPPRVPDKLKAVGQELGHEIRIFSSTTFELMTSKLPRADQEEDDDFYELQPGDYYKLISNRIAEQSKVLKTRKIREAELAAQRARLTKVGRNMMHYATI